MVVEMGFYEDRFMFSMRLSCPNLLLKKFTLIGPDVSRGSDAIRVNPLSQDH
jgi:hypothetical protein